MSMALRPSSQDDPIPLAEFLADLERRRAAAGPLEAPRNDGARRTESKKALLRAIAALGGDW